MEDVTYQKKNNPLSNLKVVKDIEQTGSLGPIAGAVANIQLMEIFKVSARNPIALADG